MDEELEMLGSILGAEPIDPLVYRSDLIAENITYDDEETYSDGTVGKELTELKSDIMQKQDKGKATVNDVEYELGRHTLSVTDSGVTTSYNFLTAEVIENGD